VNCDKSGYDECIINREKQVYRKKFVKKNEKLIQIIDYLHSTIYNEDNYLFFGRGTSMKKTLLVLVLLAAFVFPAAAESFTNDLSVGAAVGSSFTATAKYEFDDALSAAAFVGTPLGDNFLYFRGEANYDMADWEFAIENAKFYPYVGGGATVLAFGDGGFKLAADGLLGVSYYFDDMPLEVFLELGPGLILLQGSEFALDFDYNGFFLGARYALGN